MKIDKHVRSSGQGVALLLPWALAVAGVVFGLYAWTRSGPEPDLAMPLGRDEPKELKALRLVLSTSQAENQTLRQELARMLGAPGARRARASSKPPATEGDADSEARRQDVTKRLEDALSRWSNGSAADKAAVSRLVWEALSLKDNAFATLRDVYLNTADPQARALLAGSMAFSHSPEVGDFFAEQAQQEKDPMLRRLLLTQAAKYAPPESAERLESTFLESLDSSDDAELRKAAIQGLRYARGEGVGDALLRAASDRDEGVRLAAIDALSSRQEVRHKLIELISQETSPHVREVGNCQLLIAQEAEQTKRKGKPNP